MATTTRNTAIYWDLDHLNAGEAGNLAGYELQPGSALADALAHARVQRALGRASTIESSLACALERSGVELIETCGGRQATCKGMGGFLEIAADDMALDVAIHTIVLVSMRGDVGEFSRFVRRCGRRFVQLRRAEVCPVESPTKGAQQELAA
jgi:hypothetical protein